MAKTAMAATPTSCCEGQSARTSDCCGTKNPKPEATSCCSPSKENSNSSCGEGLGNSGGCCKEESYLCEAKNKHCVALVQDDSVVLIDAQGSARTFQLSGNNGNKQNYADLCFDDHHSKNVADLLTPCLDKQGRHLYDDDELDEPCFCGVEEPHLHAHSKTKCSINTNSNSTDVQHLAAYTLDPVDDTDDKNFTNKLGNGQLERPLLRIPVSEQMPRDDSNGLSGGLRHRKVVARVTHDDHQDDLVHSRKYDSLHLEHTLKNGNNNETDDCGCCPAPQKTNVHGVFEKLAHRAWEGSSSSDSGKQQRINIRVSFFGMAQDKFDVAQHSSLFSKNTKSGCRRKVGVSDAASTNSTVAGGSKNKTVRSVIRCGNICCSSEIPIVNETLEVLNGVSTVKVNVPLRQVLVDYNPGQVKLEDLVASLNEQGLNAQIERNGETAEANTVASAGNDESSSSTFVKSTFYVLGICCASEIPAIEKIVQSLPGDHQVRVNVTSKSVYIEHNPAVVTAEEMAEALTEQGFPATILVDGAHVVSAGVVHCESRLTVKSSKSSSPALIVSRLRQWYTPDQLHSVQLVDDKQLLISHNPNCLSAEGVARELNAAGIKAEVAVDGADQENWDLSWLASHEDKAREADASSEMTEPSPYPKPTVLLSGIAWIISMLSLAGGKLEVLAWVGLVSVAFGLPTIALKAFRTLKRRQFDANCLMLFASVGAVALQEYAEAAAVVFLFASSEWLESRATARARRALGALVALRPDTANVVHPLTKELVSLPASRVPVGAVVCIKTGEMVPCDGKVIDGVSTLDESSLTGESRPIRKSPGEPISGGTVNCGRMPIMALTTSTADDSAVSKLIRLVEEAQANRSETEKFVDTFARYYTPVIVLSALLMCSIPWFFGRHTGREWTENGLILIVVACPCALIISTPVTYVAALAATAQNGILIKGGAYLEALGCVQNICFDKTGTLTKGEFALEKLESFSKQRSREEVFQYLALMEERASHPVAQSILAAAKAENIAVPKTFIIEKHAIIDGEGVVGVINDQEIHVGNERMFERLGLLDDIPSKVRTMVESWKFKGGTVGFMGLDGEGIVCAFVAADSVREESPEVVRRFKKQGIAIKMLTGDNHEAALAVGREVGLNDSEVKSKLLPKDKLDLVEALSAQNQNQSALSLTTGTSRLTLMVGDGVNDAPSLAAANISCAMGSGATLAMETADVTLLDSNLEKLEYSMRMGRRVIRKIKENIIFSVSVKFLVLGFALAGQTHLWAAIASDVGAMILVTLNSMTLLPLRHQSPTRLQKSDSNTDKAILSNTILEIQPSAANSDGTIDIEK